MPQFILIAKDAKDDGAYERRMNSRAAHLQTIEAARDEGKILCGLALLNDEQKMCGSVIVTNFADRKTFDQWLAADPYTIHKVWDEITVLDAALAPTFAHLVSKKNAA